MYDAICSYIAQVPFFSSAAFGILAMVIQGCSGCAVGLIMGAAPKRGVDPGLVQFLGAFVSIPVSIAIMVAGNAYPQGEFWPVFWTCASSFYTGASNFIMLLIMSSAMQSGPNGIIWAIAQSAFVFPFISSVAFFGVELTFLRLSGIIILLASVVLYGAIKDNSTKSGHWKLKAFICLAMCAVQQNITTLPSYYASTRGVPSVLRSICEAGAIALCAIIYNLVLMDRERITLLKNSLKNPSFWKYVAVIQMSHLVLAYIIFYPGLNTMADNGLGGMCFPLMIGSCIVLFTVISIVFLRERLRLLQALALIFCVAGLILICTRGNDSINQAEPQIHQQEKI